MSPYLLNSFLTLLSIGMLWKGAELLVVSASKIAHRFGISDLVIGLTVVAIGTSAPEFAVTISAAMSGKANISVSNVVGSNIFNLGFILGGCAAIRAIATTPKLVYRDGIFLISVTCLLTFFLHDLELARWEGVVLFSLLICYIVFLFINKEPLEDDIPTGVSDWKDFLYLVISIAVVVGGGHILVDSASNLARLFGVSEWTIGVTIVAAGTSAPEMATSLMAAAKGRHGMALGNLIGSDLFNLLGVLGLAGMLKPLYVTAASQSSMYLLVLMVAVVVIFMRTGWKISRLQGSFLVVVNLIRWVIDFMSKA